MPNWCRTSYTFYTDTEKGREQLADFYNKLTASISGKHLCITKSDFGNKWLGNVIHAFTPQFLKLMPDNAICTYEGYDVRFRGSVIDIMTHGDNEVLVITETAWGPMTEMWDMILKSCGYDNISYVYQAEESNNGLFVTNDKTGRFYNDKYYVDLHIADDFHEYETDYISSDEDLLNYLNAVIDDMRNEYNSHPKLYNLPDEYSADNLKHCDAIDEAIAVIEANLPDNDEAYIIVNKFEIVD